MTIPASLREHQPESKVRPWVRGPFLPLLIFAISRVVVVVLVLLIAPSEAHWVSRGGERVPVDPSGATYWDIVTNWDGQWYLEIARHGYPTTLPLLDGSVQQNPWAFYPLFPFLAGALLLVGVPFSGAATLINLAAGAGATVLLFRLLQRHAGWLAATLGAMALCFYPAAPVLQFAYTEALALLLVLWCLKSLIHRKYAALLAATTLLALTRPIALPLTVAVWLHAWIRWRKRNADPFQPGERQLLVANVLWAPFSFALWPAVAAAVTGRFDAYLATQRAWSSELGTQATTWASRSLHNPTLGLFLLIVGCVFTFLLFRPGARAWPLEARAWALAYLAYIACTGLVSTSVIRYLLLVGIVWWPLPELRARLVPRGAIVTMATTVALLGIWTQWLWLQHYFVLTSDWSSIP